MKIVSLLPSTSEIVCQLGFERHLAGRSHECEYPPSVKQLPVLTEPSKKIDGNSPEIDHSIKSIVENGLSLYRVKPDLLADINPDVVLTQDHCEVCAVSLNEVEKAVQKYCDDDTEVLSVSPTNLSEILDSFYAIGEAIGAGRQAEAFVHDFKMRLDIIRKTVIGEPAKRVVSIEWIDPLMTAGNWIPELIEIAGGEYLLAKPGEHSPSVEWENIVEENPDVILIMPCGYDIDQTKKEIDLLTERKEWNELKAVQNSEVYLLDGNRFFNRPGPGIYESTRILGEILHPEHFKPIHQNRSWIRIDRLPS